MSNGRLKIIDYFDVLISQIDLTAERLLQNTALSNVSEIEDINKRRVRFIDEIENVKKFNLANFNDSDEILFKKKCLLFDKKTWQIRNYEAESLDSKMIEILVVLEDYVSDAELDMFKELLTLTEPYDISYDDDEVDCELLVRIKGNSRIFNALYRDVQKRIRVSFEIFTSDVETNYVIHTTKQNLFAVTQLNINGPIINSKPLTIISKALELFFARPVSVSIQSKIANEHTEYAQFIDYLTQLTRILDVSSLKLNIESQVDLDVSMLKQTPNLHEINARFEFEYLENIFYWEEMPYLKVLRLSNNLFTRLPFDDDLRPLEVLHLSNFKINQISENIFHALVNLTQLKLNATSIESLPESLFSQLTSLTYLDLSLNKIRQFEPGTFSTLTKLKILNLSVNRLVSIDHPALFANLAKLETLDLSSNQLSHICVGAFAPLTNLTSLNLNDNAKSLTRIDPDWFRTLTNLNTLKLSTTLEFKIFSSLPNLNRLYANSASLNLLQASDLAHLSQNLKILDLNDNGIEHLVDDLFSNVPNLEKLNLSFNQISRVDEFAFRGLQNLTYLNLRSNQMESLRFGNDMTRLTELNLSKNKLTDVPKGEMLPNLRVLNLDRNQIERIEPGVFTGYQRLEELNLLTNRIGSVEPGAFDVLKNLHTLNLSENCIESIGEGSFRGLVNLKKLIVNHNRIDKIAPGAFVDLKDLRTLELSSNKIETGIDLKDVPRLVRLNLNFNKLKRIQPDTFGRNVNLVNLRHLLLCKNEIAQIDAGSFDKLVNLTHLYLNRNTSNLAANLDFTLFSQLAFLKFLNVDKHLNKKKNQSNRSVLEKLEFLEIID